MAVKHNIILCRVCSLPTKLSSTNFKPTWDLINELLIVITFCLILGFFNVSNLPIVIHFPVTKQITCGGLHMTLSSVLARFGCTSKYVSRNKVKNQMGNKEGPCVFYVILVDARQGS